LLRLSAPLVLLGCGKMGGALLAGWLDRGLEASAVHVVEPSAAALAGFAAAGLSRVDAASDLAPGLRPDVALLAVKPQVMAAAMAGLERFAGSTLFVSIAAGKTIGFFEERLGGDAAVVRAMPNTPAAVGRGMTVLCANANVDARRRELAADLLAAVGEVAWVEDEALLDPVTAVSGGGPAYVFLLIECLAQAGVEAGLPKDLALRLARVTVAGSGELVFRSAEPADQLRRNVTSPGGTTQEALAVLMAEDGLQPLLSRAIAAATRRSRELAS
jgi:pyrroline-5-carboxylate reductase